jgi:hypothetical protein
MEIDLRDNPWEHGIPIDSITISKDIYYLLCFFTASKNLSKKRKKDAEDSESVYGYSIRSFELTEIGNIVISISSILRNQFEINPSIINDRLKMYGFDLSVGVLIEDLNHPDKTKVLHLKESWNKILHCNTMNCDRSKGTSIYSGHLNPIIHFYGELRGKKWKATINIFNWCEAIHVLI